MITKDLCEAEKLIVKQKEKNMVIIAEFANPKALLKAAGGLRYGGYEKFEAYSPFPVHGMDEAMGLSDSRLGWIVMISALAGALGGLFFQAWASAAAYRLVISGKPFLSVEAFIPVTFELTILCAAFSTFFGLLILNKLPAFYHIVFKSKNFHRASSESFFISVDSTDIQFDRSKTVEYLERLGGENIETLID